jgi:DNA-binding transcriptional ArsR family regulator
MWRVMPATKARAPQGAGAASAENAELTGTLAAIFAALGDPTRLKLVAALCEGGAYSIAQLTETTDISRQGVTKHLNVLAAAGVVSDLKAGRERLWQLEVEKIAEARLALESIGREWEQALGRLKSFVEKND